MANQLPPIPQDKIEENPRWREWFRNLGNYIQQVQFSNIIWPISSGGTGADTATGARNNLGLGSMAVQNADNVAILGGTIDNTTIGATTPSSGKFTTNLYRNGYTVKPNCYIEVYDTSATIGLTATPTLLRPASTGSSSGITYSSSTGVITFAQEGDYTLTLSVNALASNSNQFVYIYAENNTGSGWTVNTNSGKIYQLVNNQPTQIVYANAIHRVAGQQVRYWIYSNATNVALHTQTLPGTTAIVPAIRIQYS